MKKLNLLLYTVFLLILVGCKSTEMLATPEETAVYDLEAQIITKELNGTPVQMFGYNGQVPGPVIKVKQNSELVVNFKNSLEVPTTVHWHGVRLDNKFDGVPNITQDPVLPGETFVYELKFPDEGVYWYHPHVREDMQQEMGLYGNIIVEPELEGYYNPVDKEEVLFLDDIRISEGQIEEFSEEANYVLMGRFGNVMLVNGLTNYALDVKVGDIVRFYLTDSANTRIFNVSIENTKLKVVGSDSGLYEKDFFSDSVVISPSERVIIEVLFDTPGQYQLMHINPHNSYELGVVNVAGQESNGKEFETLNEHSVITESMVHMREYFDAPPDIEIDLTIEMSEKMMNMMSEMEHGTMGNMKMEGMKTEMMVNDTKMDGMMENGSMEKGQDAMADDVDVHRSMSNASIEWEDEMPKMNAMSTSNNTKWILRDKNTGKENMDIDYEVNVGDVKKIRLFNDPESAHPMQHPIHLHGQRFLVLSVNGEENHHLVWKDTVLVPKGATVDILVDFTNPGDWMIHCHIGEHITAGMMGVFKVL